VDTTVPTPPAPYAVLSFPPGLDENRLTVLGESGHPVASTSWRPTTQRIGVGSWDQRLAGLGYARTGDWRPTEDSRRPSRRWWAEPRGRSSRPAEGFLLTDSIVSSPQ
jgi:hypothetical protein